MAKYSFEFKLQVVQDYLNGEGGYEYLTHKYDVSCTSIVRLWVKVYKAYGEDGLRRSKQKKEYSFDEKLSIVQLYLTTEISYRELAIKVGINNPSSIARWVSDYRIAGPKALRPRKKGRKKTLDKTKKSLKGATDLTRKVDTSEEHVRELEDELLKLRIENAYLKELRRLRLEEEKRQREKQE